MPQLTLGAACFTGLGYGAEFSLSQVCACPFTPPPAVEMIEEERVTALGSMQGGLFLKAAGDQPRLAERADSG